MNNISCTDCVKTFKSAKTFSKHLKTQVSNTSKNFVCESCNKAFKSEKRLEKHKRSSSHYDLMEIFDCHTCDKVYKNRKALEKHFRRKCHIKKCADYTDYIPINYIPIPISTPTPKHECFDRRQYVQVSSGLFCEACNRNFKDQKAIEKHFLTLVHRKKACSDKDFFKLVNNNDIEGVSRYLDEQKNPEEFLNLKYTGHYEDSALMVASRKGYLDMVRLLVEKDALLYIQNATKEDTALHMAVCSGHAEVVEYLLKVGNGYTKESLEGRPAIVDIKNSYRRSPLLEYINEEYDVVPKIVELLLEAGASIDDYENKHSSILNLLEKAITNGYTRVVELIRSRL